MPQRSIRNRIHSNEIGFLNRTEIENSAIYFEKYLEEMKKQQKAGHSDVLQSPSRSTEPAKVAEPVPTRRLVFKSRRDSAHQEEFNALKAKVLMHFQAANNIPLAAKQRNGAAGQSFDGNQKWQSQVSLTPY